MNLFNLSLQFNGYPIHNAIKKLKEIQSISEDDYADYIENQKRAIYYFHLTNNSFYNTFAPNTRDYNWNSIPIMTKRDLQCPLKDRLSKNYTSKNCYINKTSGSSGDPFIFAKDKFSHALSWANFIDRYHWYDIDFSVSKQARFYGIPLNKKGYYKERLKDFLGNRFRFSVFDLSDNMFEKNIRKFKEVPFKYINGYTSSIVQFAKYLNKKNKVLKSICPTLQICIVTSEMLFDDDRLLLEKQLGIPVINEYGSAELGLIAFQNNLNEWVVNSDDLFIEILDTNNNPLPYGEIGKIVITSLYNKAHPFIRYEIGDVGSLSTKSSLKYPILNTLQGRTSDLVSLPSGKTAAGLTFYYVTKSVIEDNANVKEFIIEQIKHNTFIISYVSDETLPENTIGSINRAIEKYLEPNLITVFERKDKLERSERGKLRQFKSYV